MRAALRLTLLSISSRSFLESLRGPANLSQFGLDLIPSKLHRSDKRALSATLVYASISSHTFLCFNLVIEDSRSIAEEPQFALLLVKIGVPIMIVAIEDFRNDLLIGCVLRPIVSTVAHLFLPSLLHRRFLSSS